MKDEKAPTPSEPECPGPNCLMCNGEACNKCGAGCWERRVPPARPRCEHSVDERHHEAEHADGLVIVPPFPVFSHEEARARLRAIGCSLPTIEHHLENPREALKMLDQIESPTDFARAEALIVAALVRYLDSQPRSEPKVRRFPSPYVDNASRSSLPDPETDRFRESVTRTCELLDRGHVLRAVAEGLFGWLPGPRIER